MVVVCDRNRPRCIPKSNPLNLVESNLCHWHVEHLFDDRTAAHRSQRKWYQHGFRISIGWHVVALKSGSTKTYHLLAKVLGCRRDCYLIGFSVFHPCTPFGIFCCTSGGYMEIHIRNSGKGNAWLWVWHKMPDIWSFFASKLLTRQNRPYQMKRAVFHLHGFGFTHWCWALIVGK